MLELTLDADPGSLATMADAIVGYAVEHAVPPDKAVQLIVALDEVVTNVIAYGGLGAGAKIRVVITREDDAISAVVEDPGRAFDPLHETPAPPLTGAIEDRPTGGLGLHIVRTMVQDLTYQRADSRNRLVMRLALSPPGRAAADSTPAQSD